MLPCNIVVQEHADHNVEVSAIDPIASMQVVDNPQLSEEAKQVQTKLEKVIDNL